MKTLLTAIVICAAMLISFAAFAQDEAQPIAAATQESPAAFPADNYTIFYSPPEKLDALFDAFVAAIPYDGVDDFAVENPVEPGQQFYTFGAIWPDEEKLAALRDEFGYMPEYWQLRYSFAVQDYQEKTKYLAKAYSLFPQDPATVYFYALNCVLPGAAKAASDAKSMRIEQAVVELMKQAAALDGKNAFYCYEAAFYSSNYAGVDGAMPLIIDGNNRPVSEYVSLFPYSYMVRNMQRIQDLYPEKHLLLASIMMSEALPSFIKRKDFVKEIEAGVNLSGNLDWLTETNRYMCRYGGANYASRLQILVALAMLPSLRNCAFDLGLVPDSAKAVKGWMYLADIKASALGFIRGYSTIAGEGYYEYLADEKPMDAAILRRHLETYWKDEYAYQNGIRARLRQSLDKAASFDFSDPAAFNPYKDI
jgi:hypothetical protein